MRMALKKEGRVSVSSDRRGEDVFLLLWPARLPLAWLQAPAASAASALLTPQPPQPPQPFCCALSPHSPRSRSLCLPRLRCRQPLLCALVIFVAGPSGRFGQKQDDGRLEASSFDPRPSLFPSQSYAHASPPEQADGKRLRRGHCRRHFHNRCRSPRCRRAGEPGSPSATWSG